MAWDRWSPGVIFDALIPAVYLPAWLIAPAAVLARRRVLAVVALALIVAQVVLIVPEVSARRPLPSTAGAPTLRLIDANVLFSNPSMAGYATQIRTLRPDLVTLEEATPVDGRSLVDDGVLARLPYATELGDGGGYSYAVASRYPLTPVALLYAPGLVEPVAATTTVTVPAHGR